MIMDLFGNFLFYNIVFLIAFLFFGLGSKNKILEKIGMLVLIAISVLRYDIGHDYDTYYHIINHISSLALSQGEGLMPFLVAARELFYIEPLFVSLSYMTSSIENNFLFVFAFYSLVTIYFIYKSLKDIDSLFWGMFVLIMMGYLFVSYDQIRQVAAISIFLYSVKYIELQEWKKYLSFIILASLFHYSVLLVAPIAYFMRFRPRIKLYVFFIVLFFMLFLLNVWSQYGRSIFSLIPYYSDYASSDFMKAGDFGTGLGLLSKIIFYSFLMIQMHRKNFVYSNLLFMGVLLLIFSSGSLNINRISNYMCFVSILAFPIYMRKKYNVISFVLMLFLLLNGEMLFATGKGANGCVPYDSVFGVNFLEKIFRISDY